MPLPDAWVESLFARLAVRYGAAWLRQWDGVDIAAVKADWAEVLSGISPEAIKHALECLPIDRPPTVGQFRLLCVNRPVDCVRQLPAPKPTPERRAAVAAALRGLRARLTGSAA